MEGSVIPFCPKNGRKGYMVGREITIPANSCLSALRFCITDYGILCTEYSCGIVRRPENDGTIEHVLFSDQGRLPVAGNEWVSNTLPALYRLAPGSYLAFMRWEISPGDTGQLAQTIGFMEEDNGNREGWMNWSGAYDGWYRDTGPYRGNSVIEPVFCDE